MPTIECHKCGQELLIKRHDDSDLVNRFYVKPCDCVLNKKLYVAVNEMLKELGLNGEITTTDDKVCEVMNVLYEMDGGVYAQPTTPKAGGL